MTSVSMSESLVQFGGIVRGLSKCRKHYRL